VERNNRDVISSNYLINPVAFSDG